VDYTCRWPPCKQQRVSATLSVEKNSARPAQERLTSHFPSLLPDKFSPSPLNRPFPSPFLCPSACLLLPSVAPPHALHFLFIYAKPRKS